MNAYEVCAYRNDGTLAAFALLYGYAERAERAAKCEGSRLARHYPGVALRLVVSRRTARGGWREVFARGPGARRWSRVKGGAR